VREDEVEDEGEVESEVEVEVESREANFNRLIPKWDEPLLLTNWASFEHISYPGNSK
jgi:hypothetical protein